MPFIKNYLNYEYVNILTHLLKSRHKNSITTIIIILIQNNSK